jgi:hypothetical protein
LTTDVLLLFWQALCHPAILYEASALQKAPVKN